ncbi:MAG: hypothetical protein GXZ09_04090 [Syntrophomonadaceae bacterium]|nr:hypothetical protein [Syntrophomonadaceae bacterium]
MMPDRLKADWKGIINDSTIMIARQLIKSKDDQLQRNARTMIYGTISVGLGLTFLLINGLDIRLWADRLSDILILIACAVTTALYLMAARSSSEFGRLKDLLMKRIDARFCSCEDPCNHREKFLAYMYEVYKINLYY